MNLEGLDLNKNFNSCTVLIYNSGDNIKKQSSMGWHCDTKYRKNGVFQPSLNCQVKNTSTIILSLGDERILNWRRRKLIKNEQGKMVWIIDKSWVGSMSMNKDSMLLLNPLDEQPHFIDSFGYYYQYQHGNVKTTGDTMSFALVFRVVDEYYYYDIITNRMIDLNFSQERNTIDDQQIRLKLYKNFNKKKHHNLLLKILL